MIDVHFHHDELTDEALAETLAEARAVGVRLALDAAWDVASIDRVVALAASHEALLGAVGVHPWYLDDAVDLAVVARALDAPGIVAVGEVGLDGKVQVPMDRQTRAFEEQLQLASERGLPVVVHSRGAVGATYDVLAAFPGVVAVMHSLHAHPEMARRFLDLGAYVSFSGTVTRSNAKKLAALARYVPDDRLLVETDAPSIAIHGVPKGRVAPCHLPLVIDAVARHRGVAPETIATLTDANAVALLGPAARKSAEEDTDPLRPGRDPSAPREEHSP